MLDRTRSHKFVNALASSSSVVFVVIDVFVKVVVVLGEFFVSCLVVKNLL